MTSACMQQAFELEKRRVARMDEKPDDQTAGKPGQPGVRWGGPF
jgi:hypothetical protein